MRSKCKKCQSFIYEYVDGILLDKELTVVEAHLETCSECKMFYNQEAGFSGLIKQSMEQKLLSAHLKPVTGLRFVSTKRKPKFKYSKYFKDFFLFRQPALPIALGVILMIILGGFYLFFNPSDSLAMQEHFLTKNNVIYDDDCLIGDSFCDWKQKRLYIKISNPGHKTEKLIITSKKNTRIFSVDLES